MPSIFVVHCKTGQPCQHPLDEGLWTNFTWSRPTAENDVKRLDDPTEAQGAKFLQRNDPNAFARWKGSVKTSKCGPHRIIEYRPVG